MFKIKTFNNISKNGLERLPKARFSISGAESQPDAIILRSANLHDLEINPELKAVGRAGAGTNNVPVEKLSAHGIPVFNAPGANANAVKELVIAAMLIASRNIVQAWDYAAHIEGTAEEQNRLVEDGKKKFVGFELPCRTLGVVGLGAIGLQIANAALDLGMRVVGFDPTITVRSAWQLSANVEEMASIDELFSQSDFVTFHVPLIDATRDLLNSKCLALLKDHAVVLNFAREGIVNDDAVIAGIQRGKIHAYVSDFPSPKLKNIPGVITLPHLGASTLEAEENCAIMVAEQIKDFLENGNIRHSVNFPEIKMARDGVVRLAVANRNVPDMVAQISHVLGQVSANIKHMRNESRNGLAYTLIDLDDTITADVLQQISTIKGVLNARLL